MLDPAHLQHIIEQAAELLPPQGPITAFAFLNPLQGMEHLPFDQALRMVSQVYGCEPYLEEGRYFSKLQRGRINVEELREVLAEDLAEHAEETIAGLVRRGDLRLNILQYPLRSGHARELRWVIAETDALQRFRPEVTRETRDHLLTETRHWIMRELRKPQPVVASGTECNLPVTWREVLAAFPLASIEDWDDRRWESVCLHLLWRIVRQGVRVVPTKVTEASPLLRHQDLLKHLCQMESDPLVHEVLVGFCAAFLDQGYAAWKLPDRQRGLFAAFCELHGRRRMFAKRWMRKLPDELASITRRGLGPLASIAESLEQLGVERADYPDFLQSTLLALRGWAGMIWQTEVRPDRVHLPSAPGSLIEFLAIRLILDRLALQHVAREAFQYTGTLERFRDVLQQRCELLPQSESVQSGQDQQAFAIFQIAQINGWLPQTLADLSAAAWSELLRETTAFSAHERRRIYHAAFERRVARQALDAIVVRTSRPPQKPAQPQLQVVCCIDAREESFRRHLEELTPDVETFGTAGFFGVPMYYRGAADAHYAALCPIVIKPRHWVTEEVVFSLEETHRTRSKVRHALGSASHSLHMGTRTSVAGALVSTLLGPLATAPLVSRILFPRLTARMHHTAQQFVAPPIVTRLRLERPPEEPAGPAGDQIGFTVSEMAGMAEKALRDIGLTSNFARLVIFLGHGSSCLNNPHESAYHCGACSGNPGGANARALAAMLNDARVRRILAAHGLPIPDETHFIGGLHNTATEAITFFDLELLPTNQIRSFRLAQSLFSRVAEQNAHERCRRFESARLDLSPAEALRHVQERSEDLAQTRPEYGNSTNAVCFVGRRDRIRGLYLDRRSFLMSYDPTQDDERSSILARILAAVIPVCEGINLLYTLSAIDSQGWGSGTKLPHNVTSLLGVMDGAASDLRPGLPWQGVDIHEPVRVLFVIESSAESMLQIMEDNPVIGRICRNGWAQLAILDPQQPRIQQYRHGRFEPYLTNVKDLPWATSSPEWYSGWRDHLPFALIGTVADNGVVGNGATHASNDGLGVQSC